MKEQGVSNKDKPAEKKIYMSRHLQRWDENEIQRQKVRKIKENLNGKIRYKRISEKMDGNGETMDRKFRRMRLTK